MTELLGTNYKLDKAAPGVRIVGLSLLPHTLGGGPSLCPYSTPECRELCLVHTGRNHMPAPVQAKANRTALYRTDPGEFRRTLFKEVLRAAHSAARARMRLAVRLNVYSDVRWEREFPGLFESMPEVQFYDYTKWPCTGRTDLPGNYHLTYSYSGTPVSDRHAQGWLERGVNVAVVFNGALPGTWRGHRVVAGDDSDYRPADPVPCVVGLLYKGARGKLVNIRRFVQPGKE